MLIATVLDYDTGRTYSAHGERWEILDFFHRYFPDTRELDRVAECVEALNIDGYYKAEVKPAEEPSNMLVEGTFAEQRPEDPWVREADLEDGNL